MCDTPTLSRTERRKARTDHWCSECRRPIVAGQLYESCTTLFDGSWQQHAFCVICADAWTIFQPAIGPHGCAVIGELWSTAVETGAFRRLPAPASDAEAARLGAAIGRLYGAAMGCEDDHYIIRRKNAEEWAARGAGRSALSLLVASYRIQRRPWSADRGQP